MLNLKSPFSFNGNFLFYKLYLSLDIIKLWCQFLLLIPIWCAFKTFTLAFKVNILIILDIINLLNTQREKHNMHFDVKRIVKLPPLNKTEPITTNGNFLITAAEWKQNWNLNTRLLWIRDLPFTGCLPFG